MFPRFLEIDLPSSLKNVSRVRTFEKKQIILRPQDVPKHFYIIRSGMVKAYSVNSHGEEQIHVLLGRDDPFSIGAFLEGYEVTVFIETLTPCVIELVPLERLTEEMGKNAALAMRILQACLRQFAVYRSRLDNLQYQYASERLAFRLLLLAYRFGEVEDGRVQLPFIGHEVIAHTINLTRESVGKGLKRLSSKGIISTLGRKIVIEDLAALFAEFDTDSQELPLYKGFKDFLQEVEASKRPATATV